ncbi:MAG: GIY-YIG nuclease family protein [Bacteroidales bacterium]|nr:GIY-YIG nuclease family protein [Bacteroidales bacterium]
MIQHHVYFYILYSSILDKYYIGHTKDLDGRLRRHNSNHKGWTGNANDWTIEYTEEFEMKSFASVRELEVKKWKSRKRVEKQIKKEL